jgi:hypothetical protein
MSDRMTGGTMMVAGPPSTTHQSAHGQPNAKFDQRVGAGITRDASWRLRYEPMTSPSAVTA